VTAIHLQWNKLYTRSCKCLFQVNFVLVWYCSV